MNMPKNLSLIFALVVTPLLLLAQRKPVFKLIPAPKFLFHSFVDCNMAEVWVGDTFRIFPGKYGEDPLWGNSNELKFASGSSVDETFLRDSSGFTIPGMPPNVKPGEEGLHGAVWFETVYQDARDVSGKTLYAIYHNENYPETLPFNAATGKGYKNEKWPVGIRGPKSPSAVCRIGVMKSDDGGHNWTNRGIFIEDEQPRLILQPHNTSANFAGGVGDPSAVRSGDYIYLFYGEYGYPGAYDSATYDPAKEHAGQCISMARILISDLDHPGGKAQRWNGKSFSAAYNGVGQPITSLVIPSSKGGGPTSSPTASYYWGPSVSWNNYLQSWVMLMAKAEGPTWNGNSIYISFNPYKDLGNHSQEWSSPQLLFKKPGHVLWYPSLQPLNNETTKKLRRTAVSLDREARLFLKATDEKSSEYLSEFVIQFTRSH